MNALFVFFFSQNSTLEGGRLKILDFKRLIKEEGGTNKN